MGDIDSLFKEFKRKIEAEKARHHVEPGMTLKHFYLEDKIGQGAIADIFSARNTITGERVSIKAVRADIFVNERREEFIARFKREVNILLDYKHPNLVDIKDYGEDITLFYAMDYIEGKDLFEVIREYRERRKYIAPRRAITMAITIASVLSGMHARGMYHRDLKSENIMVEHPGTEKERFILIDLGLGKIVEQDPGLTGKYDILGTVEFMPPEQLHGEPYDERGDVYSLATILYETLCNRTPFVKTRREIKIELARRKSREETQHLARFNPDVHPKINKVVMKALKKDPDKRYQDCGEFIDALEEAVRYAA